MNLENFERLLQDLANTASIIALVIIVLEKKKKPRNRKTPGKRKR